MAIARSTVLTLALGAPIVILACSDSSDTNLRRFPNNFLFGAATAGFQSDMGCPTLPDDKCVDAESDWYRYVTSPETLALETTHLSGDDPAVVGPGHWELYETDFRLAAQEVGLNAHRMSLEWSRIFPQPTWGVEGHDNLKAIANADALETYHAMFRALREEGLTPFVTLNHYTLPYWIHDSINCTLAFPACYARGWFDRESTVGEIAKYAEFVAREFGQYVDWWGTINEPFAVLLPGYLQPSEFRTNPPAAFLQAGAAREVFLALVEGHARMVDGVRRGDTIDADGDGKPTQVGIVYALAPVRPINPYSELDEKAAQHVFYLWNQAYLDATANGMLDADLDGVSEYREDLDGRMDFIGVNYKVRIAVSGLEASLLPDLSPLADFNPLDMIMDEMYPKGIYEILLWLAQRYDRPLVITENNGQSVPKGDMEAEKRFLVEHLEWTLEAIDEGADVRGYYYWSLTDNYEWNHGMGIRLGLYRVDGDDPTKTRTPRETVPLYRKIIEKGGIDDFLREEAGASPTGL